MPATAHLTPWPGPALPCTTCTAGKVHHVTQDLASLLGSTAHALAQNGNPNALEGLLPEPFRQMHRTLVTVGCMTQTG